MVLEAISKIENFVSLSLSMTDIHAISPFDKLRVTFHLILK